MHLGHEPIAAGVDEEGAFTSHRLRDEGLLALSEGTQPHDRWVELHEFDVGDVSASPQGKCNAIACRHVWIGRLAEDLAESTCGKHDLWGKGGTDAVSLTLAHDVQGDALSCSRDIRDEVQCQRVLHQLDARIAGYGLHQGTGDLRSGGIPTCVRNAVTVVPTFS